MATIVQSMEAAAEEPMEETAAGEEGGGGQLPWEVATWVQPEGAANAVGRQ